VRESIAADDGLYRRLAPHCVKPDGTVASATFMTRGYPDDEISVHLARLTTPSVVLRLANRSHFGVGLLMASLPRAQGFEVVHDPTEGDGSHTLVRGTNSKIKCKRLAEGTVVILAPGQLQA